MGAQRRDFLSLSDIGGSGSIDYGGLRADGDASGRADPQRCPKRRVDPGFFWHMGSSIPPGASSRRYQDRGRW